MSPAIEPPSAQAIERQLQNFQIGFGAGMTVNLGTQLQRFTRGVRARRTGVQNRAAIAKTGQTRAAKQMGVDAGHLGGGVGAQAQRATRELVHQLEGLQVKGFSRAGQQGFQMLQQRRHDQLVAIATRGVEQFATEFFDVASLRGQHIGNVIREDPSRHGIGGGLLKQGFYRLAGRFSDPGVRKPTKARSDRR